MNTVVKKFKVHALCDQAQTQQAAIFFSSQGLPFAVEEHTEEITKKPPARSVLHRQRAPKAQQTPAGTAPDGNTRGVILQVLAEAGGKGIRRSTIRRGAKAAGVNLKLLDGMIDQLIEDKVLKLGGRGYIYRGSKAA